MDTSVILFGISVITAVFYYKLFYVTMSNMISSEREKSPVQEGFHDRIQRLTELGPVGEVGRFGTVFNKLPVNAAFSTDGQNMDSRFELVQNPSRFTSERTEAFLERAGFPNGPRVIFHPEKRTPEQPILEITSDMVDSSVGEIISGSDVMFTTVPDVALLVKPADCPTSVVHAITSSGNHVAGIIHAGRGEIGDAVPQKALSFLKERWGVRMKDITVGISPSMSQEHHFVDSEYAKTLPTSWNGWLKDAPPHEQNNELLFGGKLVDAPGKLIDVYREFGIPANQIALHMTDTYGNPRLLSHRYASETGQPEKNGRFAVAINLQLL